LILTQGSRSQIVRRFAGTVTLSLGAMFLLTGCGEPAVQQSTMPPAEFSAKLEKEHPELFVRKLGKKKTEQLSGRDKRAIIRQEWLKAQQQGNH
jgi:hypothetical protein